MRSALILLALASAGCQTESVHLQHNSTLTNATRGVAMLGNGIAHGAMLETTCLFNSVDGFVMADIDLPTSNERIGGAMVDERGTRVVGFSDQGVHVIQDNQHLSYLDVPVTGVVDAKPTTGGLLYLRTQAGDCLVGDGHSAERSIGACSADARLLVSPFNERAWVIDAGVLARVDSDASGERVAADLAVVDRRTGGLVLAVANRVTVQGPSGATEWTHDLNDPVTSLTDLGARGGIAAVTSARNLELLDDEGDRMLNVRLPTAAVVVTSDDGRDLSLVTEDETHNYTLADGPAPPAPAVTVTTFSD